MRHSITIGIIICALGHARCNKTNTDTLHSCKDYDADPDHMNVRFAHEVEARELERLRNKTRTSVVSKVKDHELAKELVMLAKQAACSRGLIIKNIQAASVQERGEEYWEVFLYLKEPDNSVLDQPGITVFIEKPEKIPRYIQK